MPKQRTYSDGEMVRVITPDILRFYDKVTDEYCEIKKSVFKSYFLKIVQKMSLMLNPKMNVKNVDKMIKKKHINIAQDITYNREVTEHFKDSDWSFNKTLILSFEKFLYKYSEYEKFYVQDFFKPYMKSKNDEEVLSHGMKRFLETTLDLESKDWNNFTLYLMWYFGLISLFRTLEGDEFFERHKDDDFFNFVPHMIDFDINNCANILLNEKVFKKLLKASKKGHKKHIKDFLSYTKENFVRWDNARGTKLIHVFHIDDSLYTLENHNEKLYLHEFRTLKQIYYDRGVDNDWDKQGSYMKLGFTEDSKYKDLVKISELMNWCFDERIPFEIFKTLYYRYNYKPPSEFDSESDAKENYQELCNEITDIINGNNDVVVKDINGDWMLIEHTNSHLGRNDECSCGSGLKYKKCCLN